MFRGPSRTPQLGKVTMADIVSVTLQEVGTLPCDGWQECWYRKQYRLYIFMCSLEMSFDQDNRIPTYWATNLLKAMGYGSVAGRLRLRTQAMFLVASQELGHRLKNMLRLGMQSCGYS